MYHLNVYRSISQKDRGFTLLEMLAVLTIIGILTAIAVPSVFAMMTRAKLSNSVERVRDTLEISRIQTTQKSKRCNIYIPTGNQVVSDCLISADSTSSVPDDPTKLSPSVKLDDDIVIENSDPLVSILKITYNSRGITQSSGTVVLSSKSNPSGEKKCLTIERGVGLISIGAYINATCKVGQ